MAFTCSFLRTCHANMSLGDNQDFFCFNDVNTLLTWQRASSFPPYWKWHQPYQGGLLSCQQGVHIIKQNFPCHRQMTHLYRWYQCHVYISINVSNDMDLIDHFKAFKTYLLYYQKIYNFSLFLS